MKKKIVIFLVVVLILVGGGFFWWQKREIKGSPKDYVIKETPEGKFVENKKAGFTMKVSEGWVERKIEFREGNVVLETLDIQGIRGRDGMIHPPLEKGCTIGGGVIYKKMDFDEIKKEIKEIHLGLGIKSEEFEITTINSYPALKNTFDSLSLGPGLSIYILTNKAKIYNFEVYWAPEEKERCIQELNKFFETLSIK